MRRMVVVGLVGGAVVVTAVVLARRTPHSPLTGEPDWAPLTLAGPDLGPSARAAVAPPRQAAPVPTGPPVVTPPPAAPTDAWVAPDDTGTCPESHPVKATRSSRIYHVPGGHFYARTKAERCYCDPAAAEGDGYRAAKR